MFKINHSMHITEDLHEDLMITNRAVVEIETEYHGDIHLFGESRVVLHSDLHGCVNISENSVVEYYATIYNGLFTSGDSGHRYSKAMSTSSHVISCSLDYAKKNMTIHRQLQDGELDPPLYPACKTE